MPIRRSRYGTTATGEPVEAFVLSRPGGLEVRAITYGARVTAVRTPGTDGAPVDVALGLPDLAAYEADRAYLGATIGRFANRIAHARFPLDGTVHRLTANEGPHHLHGGRAGFHAHVWQAETDGEHALLMHRTSPAGEEGHPGALHARIRLSVPAAHELRIDHLAVADAPGIVSMTNHAYWNLSGRADRSVERHLLRLDADRFLPVDADGIPSGPVRTVRGTGLDFRSLRHIGAGPPPGDPYARPAGGYDHPFVRNADGQRLGRAARVVHPGSGRWLEVWTTEPCLQLFTGGPLAGPRGRSGAPYGPGRGLALEPQRYPDAPNQDRFPSAVVRPGRPYRSTILFRFGSGAPPRICDSAPVEER